MAGKKRGPTPKRPEWAIEKDDFITGDATNLLGLNDRSIETTKTIVKRWDEVYSRNMRSAYYAWKECLDREIVGPPSDETRTKALIMLAHAQRVLGSDRLEVCRYLSIGVNYRIDEMEPEEVQRFDRDKAEFYTEMEMRIRYSLIFEVYMHVPILFGTSRGSALSSSRLLRDKAVTVMDPRNGKYADVLLGELRTMDLDMNRGTGRVVVGDRDEGDLFDATFSLNDRILREDEESEFIFEWMNQRIKDDMTKDE